MDSSDTHCFRVRSISWLECVVPLSSANSPLTISLGIVVADWNDRFTYAMADAAIATLKQHGVAEDDILVKHVPGSFELVYGATWMVENANVDAVIAIGCVIRGDTPHFDYICQGTTL